MGTQKTLAATDGGLDFYQETLQLAAKLVLVRRNNAIFQRFVLALAEAFPEDERTATDGPSR